MTVPADRDRSAFAARLRALATLLTDKGDDPDKPYTYHVRNDAEHEYERTGWLLLRLAVGYISDGDRAAGLAHDWSTRGFPSGRGEPVAGGGGELTSVEAAAAMSDLWEREANQLALERRLLDDNARSAESRVHRIISIRPNEGRQSTLLDCANPKCDHVITRIGADRPRNGRCNRCATHRLRYDADWPSKGAAEPDTAA